MNKAMKEILEKYLKVKFNYENVFVEFIDYNDSNCNVVYFTDLYKTNKELKTINIWDILSFIIEIA